MSVFSKRTALSLLFMLSTTALHGMYTESDLQICEFLSTVHGNHNFVTSCDRPEASDLYLYQCIKAISNNITKDTGMHFPSDVLEIIMSTIREFRKDLHAPCYKIYCFKSMPDVIIDFIEDSLCKKRSHESIADTLKGALHVSDRSIDTFKDFSNKNVFHHLVYESHHRPAQSLSAICCTRKKTKSDWAKILCLVAGDESWGMIINEEKQPSSFLSICKAFNVSLLAQILSIAPKEAIWKTMCTLMKDHFRNVLLLNEVISNESSPWVANREPIDATFFIIRTLLSFAPSNQEAWKLIKTPDPKEGKTALDIAIERRDRISNEHYRFQRHLLSNIVQLLESYRPT